MSNRNVPVKDRFIAAVLAGDTETITGLMDPGFVLDQPRGLVYAGEYRGVSGFMDFLERFVGAYEIDRLENTNTYFSADPDAIVLEFQIAGVMKATGERFETSQLEHWFFRDGKVLKVRPHWFEKPNLPASPR